MLHHNEYAQSTVLCDQTKTSDAYGFTIIQ